MNKKFLDLQAEYRTLEAQKAELAAVANPTDEQMAQLREVNSKLQSNLNERMSMAANAQFEAAQPKVVVSANKQLREYIQAVRSHEAAQEVQLRSDSQNVISSSVISANDVNNMTSAGIPLTIKDLQDPLEMKTIYNFLGMKTATGVKGQIQWPFLDTAVEATVGGELDAATEKTLDFSKITATPYKLGLKLAVSNEAINDESFDLVGTIKAQLNAAVGRTLNARVLALTAPATKASFVGPLVTVGGQAGQKVTFASTTPTYAELKSLKGKVLATGAEMAGFCYVMDAAMFSALEATPKDAGSGIFIIQNGKIDGDPVFITNLSAYSGRVVAGCWAYVALNQHGAINLVIDPYTNATKNQVNFVLNADYSITTLKSTPFAIGTTAAQTL